MGGLLSFCVLSGFTKTEESSVHGRFPLSSCAYWKTNSLSGKTVTGAMPVSHGETQMLLPESGSLLSIVATGRCAKVLLNGLLFLPTPRNASFPSEVLIFQASKSHALYICPPPNLLWNCCCCSHRKEGFHCCCCSVFLVSCSMLFRQSPFPFPFHLAPWPVFFSEPPELIDFLAYLYYFSVILSISLPPLRMRKLPQQQ